MPKVATSKRISRQQRRRNREEAQQSEPQTVATPEPALMQSDAPAGLAMRPKHKPIQREIAPIAVKRPHAVQQDRKGLMKRLFGKSTPQPVTPVTKVEQKPSILHPFARRAYQRDATLNSIRRGFNELSEMMGDIRTGLSASINKQAELVNELKQLPAIARKNAESIERFEVQFKQNNHELARSNEIAGSNLKLQGDALRHQAESVKALREQIRGQADQNSQLNKLFGSMGRDTRDHKREIDDLQGRLERMRESDEVIANNLGSVAGAIRHVSEQTASQGALFARLQQSMDERTLRLETHLSGKSRRQKWFMAASLMLGVVSSGAVATVALMFLRDAGAL